ncbi:MAG: hypothetical protein HYX68_28770 [Planctomycetes bacterium]|nr:hypothetical protein [Planctomycetota bacterium]
MRFDGSVNQYDTGTAVNRPDRVAEYESWVLLMHRAFIQAYGNLGSSSNTYTLHNATGGPVRAKYYGSFDYNSKVALVNAINASKPVVTGVEDANLFGATNHAFAVVGARGDFFSSLEILVYNPWGKDGQGYGFQPRDGRDDGFIWLTWSEFTSVMDGFWVRQ